MTNKHTQPCSVAAALNVFGDAWTLRIVLEAFYGATRFEEFRRSTAIAKNILADRLRQLTDDGILARRSISEKGTRFEYVLTEKGEGLSTVMLSIIQWGDRWVYGEDNKPVKLSRVGTGEGLPLFVPTWRDGTPIDRDSLVPSPGPGANEAIKKRFSDE
ncbi:MAG: helix-turn-helix domain-containing protein [Pseudomonadota bacterium]